MSVLQLSDAKARQDSSHERYLKRQAIQLASQLPESPQDAAAIIAHMETLLRTFLGSTRP